MTNVALGGGAGPALDTAAWQAPAAGLLLTDLYELNMVEVYLERRMIAPAVFEFFVRALPPTRNFLIAAGLAQVIEFLETARFTEDELAWLRRSGRFGAAAIDAFATMRFTGDVDAMAEGSVFFPDEPILRVTAPLPQAQLIETRVINLLHFQTVIASKAARMVLAAPGKDLVDFGLRRAHGAEAGLLAARAAYLAGFAGTATTPAAALFGIPIFGTMAHSFIQAHDSEAAAFEAFARSRPGNIVLVLDTYDTERAAEQVVLLANKLASDGIRISGVRLDSGDLAAHARQVRRILDAGGLADVRILASGGIDEMALSRLTAAAAPIDGFGIGTSLTTAADAPTLDCAYKLQEYAGRPKRKLSEGKATWPGRKQVYRWRGPDGVMKRDLVTLESDRRDGEALLRPVMRDGRRVAVLPALTEARAHAASELGDLPGALRQLDVGHVYPVEISDDLSALAAKCDEQIAR